MKAEVSDKIVRTVELKAPRARVWRALTTEAEFAQWFGVKFLEGKLRPGDRVKAVSTHPGYEGVEFYFNVEKVESPRYFSWRWIPGAPEPANEPMTLVEFVLEETEDGTRVTITESGFDRLSLAYRSKAFEDNSSGWEFQANSLANYLAQNR
jgi:uncharacterized protein YndB with AHSA1/START domain